MPEKKLKSASLRPHMTGGKIAGSGRAKGVQAKLQIQVKEAITQAAELVGKDGEGENGLIGYMQMLAEKHPTTFASLLSRVMPYQHNVSGDFLVKLESDVAKL